jgi:hypothetical protein
VNLSTKEFGIVYFVYFVFFLLVDELGRRRNGVSLRVVIGRFVRSE